VAIAEITVIETSKILTSNKRVNPSQFFLFAESGHSLRSHSKLYKLCVRLNVGLYAQNFFIHRIIEV